VAMFTAYLDDSGTSDIQPIAVAAAIVISAKQIIALEEQWKRFARKYGFSDFHASWCNAQNYNSDFADWDDAKTKRAFRRVGEFCKKFGVKVWSFVVKKQDFDAVVPLALREAIGSHHTWAVRHVAKHLAEWKIKKKERFLEYVFDWQDINSSPRREIDMVMGQVQHMLGEPVNHVFRARRDFPGLQCVDLLAWASYQLAMENLMNVSMPSNANVVLANLEEHRGDEGWFRVAFVRRVDLDKWVKVEMGIGKAIPALQAWAAKYPERGKRAKKKSVSKIQRFSS
jgi:hypothetical protein